ncbi:reverse transcriptase domain-containing protein [Tanacetum coccineum]
MSNSNIKEVVKKEVIKLLVARLICPIFDSPWVSHVQVVPKKGGMTIVKNEKDELVPQRTVIRWRVFDIEIRDKKGAKNLAADHLSRLENPDFERLTEIRNKKAIRVLPFRSTRQEKQKFFSDLRHYFGMSHSYLNSVLTESYEGAWPKMRRHKSFDNVTADHLEDIMASPLLQERKHLLKDRDLDSLDWSYKLDDALWAFRTTFKTPLGTTSFRINYGKACHLPVELEHKAYWTIKNCNLDLMKARVNQFLQINELDEMKLDAYESSISYKERTKRWHDKRIKAPIKYERGDKVLLFNLHLRLFPKKLKSIWYGPFSVCNDMKNGAIELYDEDGNEFIINKQRVKPYQKSVFDTNRDDDITLDNEGQVTLYLMRRSLKVLRKFTG